MFAGEIYLDLDGVLVDFRAGAKAVAGGTPSDFKRGPAQQAAITKIFDTSADFWANLHPVHDFEMLWNYVKKYNPHILSAVPYSNDTNRVLSSKSTVYAQEGKWAWVKKFTNIPRDRVNVVQRQHKSNFATSAKNGHVVSNLLIDDTAQNVNEWRSNRGVAILHVSAADTIQQLRALGV